jgi:curved DNA-binding protein CbpA
MKNYYHILGLEAGASEEEIRSAFRSKAKEFHPDVNPSEGARDRFMECQQAYAFLMDEQQRVNYNSILQAKKISQGELQRREMMYKNWVEHQQRKARARNAMEAVRYDAEGNLLTSRMWKGVNMVYNVIFMLLFLSVIFVPFYNYYQEQQLPEALQRSILFYIAPMLVGMIFLGYGYYYWFILKTDND